MAQGLLRNGARHGSLGIEMMNEFKAIVKKAQDEKAAIRAQLKELEERGELDL